MYTNIFEWLNIGEKIFAPIWYHIIVNYKVNSFITNKNVFKYNDCI